jgi:hypothetical protein
MITLEQIKALVIKSETEWLIEIHDGEAQPYIDGMIDEINDCDNVTDIAMFYASSRYEDPQEGLLTIISIMRRNCVIKD